MRASQSTCRVLDTYVVCAAVFGKHVACACVRVWPLPGGLLPSQWKEEKYSFSGFIPTNKQTNKGHVIKESNTLTVGHLFSIAS